MRQSDEMAPQVKTNIG